MPSLNILSSPGPCNIRSIAGTLQSNVQSSIQSSVNALQSSAFSIKQAPANAAVQIRQGLDTVVASTGIPTNQTQLSSLISSNLAPGIAGVARDAIQGIGLSTANLSLSRLIPFEIPKIPNFPALGKIGMYLGAGPKFIAEKVAEYTKIVPPYIPGVPMSIAQIAAVASLIAQLSKTNPSEFMKLLLQDIAKDVLKELGQSNPLSAVQSALDNSGNCNLPIISDVERASNLLSQNVSNQTRQLNLSVAGSTNSILNSIDELNNEIQGTLDQSALDIIEKTGGTGDTANIVNSPSNNTPNQSPPNN